MITRRRPTQTEMLALLDRIAEAPFTYTSIGSLRGAKPRGFHRDVARTRLGSGSQVFETSVRAINAWKMMPPGMTTLVARDAAIKKSVVVGVLCRALGLWTFNPCRIAYLIDEQQGAVQRVGFAYATLPGHMECGEEHFVCEWDSTSDEVWYEVNADSRPSHALSRVGYPYARWMESQFCRQSCEAMQRSVRDTETSS